MIEVVLEIIGFIAGVLDVGMFVADIHAFFKGRDNRRERRTARRRGLEIPSRDRWNRRVIVLTILVVILSGALIFWKA